MFRTSDMIMIALMVGAAGFTYKTKHDAEALLGHIRKLEAQIRYEEDSIDLLKADWSLLTQPSRLQKLTETFAADLALQPVEARQITGIDAVPLKPVAEPEEKETAVALKDKPPKGKPAKDKAAKSKRAAPEPKEEPDTDPVVTGEIPE